MKLKKIICCLRGHRWQLVAVSCTKYTTGLIRDKTIKFSCCCCNDTRIRYVKERKTDKGWERMQKWTV